MNKEHSFLLMKHLLDVMVLRLKDTLIKENLWQLIMNAALNILNCLVNPSRPTMLCRREENERIVQRFGKTIFR
jgi:hypothetical protein